MSDPATQSVAAPAPGTPEYVAAMVAKAGDSVHVRGDAAPAAAGADPAVADPAAATSAAAAGPVKPEWCPDKFWDAAKGTVNSEELAKSYGELERSRSAAPKAGDAAGADPAAAAAGDVSAKAAELFNGATAEFSKDGKLSDDTYAKLATAGMDRATVDDYIEGQQARAELFTSKVHTEVGGKAEYAKLVQWATANFTPAQINAFNAQVTSGDMTRATVAVHSLKQAYGLANGTAPARRLDGGNPDGATNVEHFKSSAEMTKAMADPRYKNDPAYRKEVESKVAGSMRMKINLA